MDGSEERHVRAGLWAWLPRRGCNVLLLLVVCGWGARVDADDKHAEPVAQALFEKGRAAQLEGDHEAARKFFAESQQIDPAAGTLLNLAISEAKTGRLSSAWQHSRQVLDQLAPTDSRYPIAEQLHRELAPRVPQVAILPKDGVPAGTRIWRDSIEVGPALFGVNLPVDPGTVLVVVRAPGHEDGHYRFFIAEAETKRWSVGPGKRLGPVSKLPQPQPTEPSSRILPYSLLIGGGALLAVSGVMGGLVLHEDSVTGEHCDSQNRCDEDGLDASSRGKTYSAIGTGAFAVGLPVATTGLVWLLVTGNKPDISVGLGSAGQIDASYRFFW